MRFLTRFFRQILLFDILYLKIFIIQVLKMLETVPIITVKHTFRVETLVNIF